MSDEIDRDATIGERLQGFAQALLPHRLLTALMYRLTRITFAPFKRFQIRWFIGRYRVDMAEAADPSPESYPHFNGFFTRQLRDGARPIEGDDDTVVSPADGAMSAIGPIRADALLQAKGRHYSLRALLGGDPERAARFENGSFATVYLSPRDYHRVHMPAAGILREIVYVPGRLFSVNFATARAVDGLFNRNERVICLFDSEHGPMAVILVGAMLVAGMETVWTGPLVPPHGRAPFTLSRPSRGMVQETAIGRGAEMGRFNTGSTAIVLFAEHRVRWNDGVAAGQSVRMGQAIGRLAGGAGTASAAQR